MSDSQTFRQSIPVRDSFSDVIRKNDDIIVFNVGGTRFEVLQSNFAYWPTTRLSRLVRAKSEEEILSLCEGFVASSTSNNRGKMNKKEYYFHRNWNNFNSILDLYRNMKLHATIQVCCTNFHGDLEYWGIDELLLDPCCALKHYPDMEQSKKEASRALEFKRKEEERMIYEDFGNSWIGGVREYVWNLTEHPESSFLARVKLNMILNNI